MKNILLAIVVFFLLNKTTSAQIPPLDWAQQQGGTGNDAGHSIAVDASGNVYTTGHFSDTVDFDPSSGVYNLISLGQNDIFVQKQDKNGNLIWAKQIGGLTNDIGRSITLDMSGNVYVTGFFEDVVDFDPNTGIHNLTSLGQNDIFILKLDFNGNLIWVKQMGGNGYGFAGDSGESILVDISGSVYVTGYFEDTVDFDPGPSTHTFISEGSTDVFIQKLDANGNFVWAKQIGGANNEEPGTISMDVDGNIYITGYFPGNVDFDPGLGTYNLASAGSADIFIEKLDNNGNFLWCKQMGGTGFDEGVSLTIDNNGNIYTSGYFKNTVDFDPGLGVYNLTASGLADMFIQKLDKNGNFLWAKRMGGLGFNMAVSSATDADGNLYTTGFFQNTVDFNPGVGIYNLTSPAQNDIFIQKLDSVGDFVWVQQFGAGSNDNGSSIKIDTAGNIYTTGGFLGTVDFDPNSTVTNLTSNGNRDIFIQKLGKNIINTSVIDLVDDENDRFVIYPNPCNDYFTIQFSSVLTEGRISIVDVQGKLIYSSKHNNTNQITLDVIKLPGVYFVEFISNKEKMVKKLIKTY